MMTKIVDKMTKDLDLRLYHDGYKEGLRPDYIQDEGRGCASERGEAEEACGQEHDGDAQRNGGILEVMYCTLLDKGQ